MVAGFAMRSKSAALIYPESSADSRRVRPCGRRHARSRKLCHIRLLSASRSGQALLDFEGQAEFGDV